MARAIGSQSIGQGFDSPILHKISIASAMLILWNILRLRRLYLLKGLRPLKLPHVGLWPPNVSSGFAGLFSWNMRRRRRRLTLGGKDSPTALRASPFRRPSASEMSTPRHRRGQICVWHGCFRSLRHRRGSIRVYTRYFGSSRHRSGPVRVWGGVIWATGATGGIDFRPPGAKKALNAIGGTEF